ncbi:MAG TPA: hypothetical protein VII51_08235 [Gaiellaceae bacterium]
MRVTFKKVSSRSYAVYVERDNAPALWIDSAPGFDVYLPHDLLHFVAEAEWGLDGAVFGDLAAGGNARIFVPVDKELVPKMWREQRKKKRKLPDGRRSEQLASVLEHAWAIRRRNARLPEHRRDRLAELRLDERQLERVLTSLDELAERWHSLAVGEAITLDWPRPEHRRHGRRRG